MRSSANLYQLLKERNARAGAFLDRFIYVVGIGGPAMTVPQIIKIWHEKDASGISLVTWFGYIFFAILWLWYGINHNEKPIIVANLIVIVVNSLVIVGTFLYG